MKATTTAIEKLATYIRKHGPVLAARVSSTQTSQPWAYWDVVPYEVRLRARDSRPTAVAQGRAGFGTRSERKAARMLAEYCEDTGRLPIDRIGPLTEADAARLLEMLEK